MLKQERYTDGEYEKMYLFAMQKDKVQSAIEVNEHQKFFGQNVVVTRGRKIPVGTQGVVFYLSRKHYGQNRWFGYATRVGIKTADGVKYWTSTDNIELCSTAGGAQ